MQVKQIKQQSEKTMINYFACKYMLAGTMLMFLSSSVNAMQPGDNTPYLLPKSIGKRLFSTSSQQASGQAVSRQQQEAALVLKLLKLAETKIPESRDLVSLLEQLQAKNPGIILGTTPTGMSLLHIAARNDFRNIARYLIERRLIDLNSTDNYKQTPINYANQNGNSKIVALLVKHGARFTPVPRQKVALSHKQEMMRLKEQAKKESQKMHKARQIKRIEQALQEFSS